MEKEIYAMLKAQIHPDQILDDIAEMFYSAITAERHLYPKLMNRLAHYNSFQQLIDAFDREGTDEEILIFGDVLDMIEQELDDTFDEGEDRVKEQLMQEPMASAVWIILGNEMSLWSSKNFRQIRLSRCMSQPFVSMIA